VIEVFICVLDRRPREAWGAVKDTAVRLLLWPIGLLVDWLNGKQEPYTVAKEMAGKYDVRD
jgi:hypothetical protein